MKKSFLYVYFLFYILSLGLLEFFLDMDTFFNCAIFIGLVMCLEIVSFLSSYLTYKVFNYYNIQRDFVNRKQCVILILKRIFCLSLIGFFALMVFANIFSNLIIGDSSLKLVLQFSSIIVLYLPLMGVLRGLLCAFNRISVVKLSYLLCSFFHFCIILIMVIVRYCLKVDSFIFSYILIFCVIFLYFGIFVWLLKINRDSIRKSYLKENDMAYLREKRDMVINRINTYSFAFLFFFLVLFMFLDVFYGKTFLSMGVRLDDLKKFGSMTVFIGPFLNFIFILILINLCGKVSVSKENILSFLIDILKISLPLSIFISLVYNYYSIYKYFIWLVPVQLVCLIILVFLYKQNKRKIILNTLVISLFVKQLLNIILLNSFKYTGILNYNALITGSLLTYLLMFIVLTSYSVSVFKLDGEHLVKSIFDIITNLVFSISIVLILKHIIYFDNLLFAIMYVIIGMLIYKNISKIIKHF